MKKTIFTVFIVCVLVISCGSGDGTIKYAEKTEDTIETEDENTEKTQEIEDFESADEYSDDDNTEKECATEGEMRFLQCGFNGNGTQKQVCTDGYWENEGDCDDPDMCENDTTRDVACGLNNNGTQEQLCVEGQWENEGDCDDPDMCENDTTRDVACGLNNNGTQEQLCVEGQWENEGDCDDPDECVNSDTHTVSCGFNDNGEQDQECVSGQWEDDGTCDDPDECTNGNRRNVACGFNNSGTQEECVSGQWQCDASEYHAGLEWSSVSPEGMNHFEATDYCEDDGWRLPTISELRTLIQNCGSSETGGACGVTDSCFHGDCWTDVCQGCIEDNSGKYNVFGDTHRLWSSTVRTDLTTYAWRVYFDTASVSGSNRSHDRDFRCVRDR